MFKLIRRVVAVVVLLAVAYVGVTFAQVWLAARRDEAAGSPVAPADAIVVLGAAQYNGTPSKVLRARLDHAGTLYRRRVAPTVWVTGGKLPSDSSRFTEASVSADYLASRYGVPQSSLKREVQGRNTWDSLAVTAAYLKRDGKRDVVLVSDPFHNARIAAISKELGLRPRVSPTRTSPITGATELRYLARETVAVALGRIVGFRNMMGIEKVRTNLQSGYPDRARSGVV
ncbi:MAG TPA: YdcF family protein [Acidimicrobiales bacterium]|nr:YdcF family protein [Acidimicrobiales bacterium]